MNNANRIELAPGYTISRVIKGGWQLAGDHGDVNPQQALDDMAAYYDSGITTFDCADIYTGVEEMIGAFRRDYTQRRGADALSQLKVHTKYVPDLSTLATMQRQDVEKTIDRSLSRLSVERLDMVQFHWWDYSVPRYAEVAGWLADLQRAGKIHQLSGTNFDTARTADILAGGIPLLSMQVQYSLLDQRPAKHLAAYARTNKMHLLCYGAVAGGFLSERWLGQPEPTASIANRSLVKYKLVIDDFGGWALYQSLLRTLKDIADRHQVAVSTIAMRWVLEQPGVAAVLVGVRRGDHLHEHRKVMSLRLTVEDHMALNEVLHASKGIDGDVYSVERDIHGRHGSIMKYELNGDTPK